MLAIYAEKYNRGIVWIQIGFMRAVELDKGKGRIYNIERNKEYR